MTRLAYLCHPVAGADEVQRAANLAGAAWWLRWLIGVEPETTVIAPWLGPLLARVDDDADPAARDRGLRDCCRVVARCDVIVLCGGRISAGMALEIDAARGEGVAISDLTSLGPVPPLSDDMRWRSVWIAPPSPIAWGEREWTRRSAIAGGAP